MARIELSRGWAELRDLKRINYGEAKRLRKIVSAGSEDAADHAIIECVTSWEVYDTKTDETLSEVSVATLDRIDPNDVLTIATAVGEGLKGALPLASKSGPAAI